MARLRSQTVKIGLFVVTVTAILLASLALMGALKFWRPVDHYHVITDETVAGLDVNSAVTLRGVAIGKVQSIELDHNSFTRVHIELEVDPSVVLPLGCMAYFERVGLTGERAINISGGDLSDGRLPPGSVIPRGQTELDRLQNQAMEISGELSTLVASITQTVEHIDTLVAAIDADHVAAVVESVEPERVASILAQADRATTTLASTSARLQRTVGEARAGIRQITDNVDMVATKAGAALDHADVIAAKAGAALDQADTAMQALTCTIANVDGVVQTNREDLRTTVKQLRRTSEDAAALIEKLREQPSLLLRSKKPKRPRRRPRRRR